LSNNIAGHRFFFRDLPPRDAAAVFEDAPLLPLLLGADLGLAGSPAAAALDADAGADLVSSFESPRLLAFCSANTASSARDTASSTVTVCFD
jgi:hypothetical protein